MVRFTFSCCCLPAAAAAAAAPPPCFLRPPPPPPPPPQVRNMVDAGALNDLKAASAFELYTLPKMYSKNYYCVSCAVHSRIVRVRNVEKRRIREPPVRFRRSGDKPGGAGAAKPATA